MPTSMDSRITQLYTDRFPRSAELYSTALELFPSGVTHDQRFLKPFPVYADRAAGSRKTTVDGPDVIDYWVGHGAVLLGHSHPAVVEAIQKQAPLATHPGACHELELQWCELVQQLVPSAELTRFTSSGTEATLMAIRVSRIASGKTKVIKFAGQFGGWHDGLIHAAEPPRNRTYDTPGIPAGHLADLILVPPNDLAALEAAIEEHDPACVIHEGNGTRWGTVPARPDFLKGLREVTQRTGVIFILDEVITGFRVHPNCFQGICDIVPDLTTLAKVLAGGLPGGCLTGRADLMQVLAFDNPLGKKMKHPGTYNANPLSAAAGIAALKIVATGEPGRVSNERAATLRSRLNSLFQSMNSRFVAYGDYSAIKILPDYDGPRGNADDFIPYNGDWQQIDRTVDASLTHAYRCALLLGGVDWMGWGGSTSLAHSESDIDQTVGAFEQAITLLRSDGFDV
ncbi:MAG: aminotransferase class III-fold pyridoxal phosphate-dependent enzyme [Planctomycetaceae bacterium]